MAIEVWNEGEIVQVLDCSQVLIPVGEARVELDRVFEHFGRRWSVRLPPNALMLLPPGTYVVRSGGKVICSTRSGVTKSEI